MNLIESCKSHVAINKAGLAVPSTSHKTMVTSGAHRLRKEDGQVEIYLNTGHPFNR
jgi:hypothetical protein